MTWWLWLIVAIVVYFAWGWLCAYFNFLQVSRDDDETMGMQVIFGPPISIIAVIYGFCMAIHWTWMRTVRLLGRTVPSR